MADAVFDKAREGFANGDIDWTAATIKAALIRGYTLSQSHEFVSDVTGAGGTLVASQTLTGKTATGGLCDAADPTFPAVAAGAPITAILIYQASAVAGGADVAASAQRVIARLDGYANLPVTPNGGDIAIAFDDGANRIFKL